MKKINIILVLITFSLITQTFRLPAQEETNDQISIVELLVSKGDSLTGANQPDSAIGYYNLAAKYTLEEGDTSDYLALKVTVGLRYGYWGEFDNAYQAFDSVILAKASEEVINHPRFEAYYYKCSYLISQRRFDEALACVDSASKANFQIKSKAGIVRKSRLSLLKAFSHLQLSQLTASESFFEESLHIYDSLEMDLELAQVLNHYGELKSAMLKADEAIQYFKQSKEIYERYPSLQGTLVPSLYTSMGQAYRYLGLNQNAVSVYKKADILLSSIDVKNFNLAEVNVGLAEALIALGEYEKALEAIEKAIPIAKLNYGEGSLYVLKAELTLGRVFRELGQYDKAYQILSEGIALFNNGLSPEALDVLALYTYEKGKVAIRLERIDEGLSLIRSSIDISLRSGADFEASTIELYQNLANIYLLINQPDSAATYYNKSLSVGDRGNSTVEESGLQVYHEKTYEALMGRVVAFEMKYAIDKDRQWLDSAYRMLVIAEKKMSYFREFPSDISKKLEIGKEISNSLQAGISVCYELYELTNEKRYVDRAYTLVEKSKSNQALFDFPVEQLATESVPDSVLNREKSLNAAISTLETLMYQELNQEAPDSVIIADYKEQIIEFTDQLVSLKYEIGQQFPDYFQLKYNRDYLSIEETQSTLLETNDVLINYHYQEDELYIFEISKIGFEFLKVETSDDFEDDLKSLIKALNQPGFDAKSLLHYDTIAHQISQMLLPNLNSFPSESSLIIVPDGPIHRVPFEVLTKNLNNERSGFNSLDYLIRSHLIRYTTSATMLAYQMKRENNGKDLVAFAPSFSKELTLAPTETDSVRGALGNLVYSKNEVENIGKYFKSTVFLDTSATEKAFRNIAGDYSVVHLASHALLDEENSLFSRILFSPYNLDSINDGSLNNREILGLNIQADMVVLSACNTGSGDVIPGEGVMSLANGFSYAGANSLVMTLWPANDQSTANIMDSFYKNLSEGASKSTALREAKLTYLEEANSIVSHPYYWAHFVLNGDDKPLVSKGISAFWWLLLLLPVAYLITSRLRSKSAA